MTRKQPTVAMSICDAEYMVFTGEIQETKLLILLLSSTINSNEDKHAK